MRLGREDAVKLECFYFVTRVRAGPRYSEEPRLCGAEVHNVIIYGMATAQRIRNSRPSLGHRSTLAAPQLYALNLLGSKHGHIIILGRKQNSHGSLGVELVQGKAKVWLSGQLGYAMTWRCRVTMP